MPFGLPLKSSNPGSPWAYDSAIANGYLLPDPNRPELLNTGATEYKIGFDDITIPSIVNGNYMDDQQSYQRYLLTGEKFKQTDNPESYSNFYNIINELGIMREKLKYGGKINNTMKSKYMFGGALHGVAKAFGANDNIANTLGMVGGAAGMFINPLSGGIQAAQYGTQLAKDNFEFGGTIDKSFTEFEGNSHAQGGISRSQFHEVESGEAEYNGMIFSNVNDYSTKAKKIANKYKKRGEDKMAKEAMDRELSNLFALQESDPVILEGRTKSSKQMFQFGGNVGGIDNPNEYTPDGIVDPTLVQSGNTIGLFNPTIPGANTIKTQTRAGFRNIDGSFNITPNNTKTISSPTQSNLTPQGTIPISQGLIDAHNAIQQPGGVTSGTKSTTTPGGTVGNQNMISPWGAVMNSIGPAAQLAGTLINGVDNVNFERINPSLVDYSATQRGITRDAGNAMATNRMNVANNARSAGQLLSNTIAGNVGINRNANEMNAKLSEMERNTNAQILNQTNAANTQIGNNEQIAREQNRAAYRQAIYGSLTDLGNIGAGFMRDNAALRAQDLQNNRALSMLGSLPYNYEWKMDENGNIQLGRK